MPKVYAFDVDETLEISNGPVMLKMMLDLRAEGHVVGLCGNWGCFFQRVPDWGNYISFFNAFIYKPDFMKGLKDHAGPYMAGIDEFVMVGNVLGAVNSLGVICGSADSEAASLAGWRFIKEDDFAAGAR